MTTAVMRPVRREDFDQVLALAKLSGGGMTNLPSDPDALRARIEFSAASYEANAEAPSGEVYMLVLEEGGKILGTAAIFSAVGLEHGFVNYRINKTVHVSKQLKKRVERRLLMPTHDFTGCSEVGSLFLSPEARGGGFGKFLAKARYLFIAQHRRLIADPVCAELRGWRDEKGVQPFWESLGKLFFDMEFEDADLTNSAMGNQFISDLLPRHPIYVAMLPQTARDTLGKPHDDAMPAFNMLLREGFAFRGYIDVFDAGPLVDAHIDDIATIKNSNLCKVAVGDPGDAPAHLMATGYLTSFRVARGPAKLDGDTLTITKDIATALGVKPGDDMRAVKW